MVEFIVTVPGGTVGGYYISGVQTPIIPVVTGETFRFTQNDSTNNNHPLILSTTTISSGIISTGVSYYLDGASNATNYRNTALFNAASVRYIEITVAQTSEFYYLCSVHGYSMGNSIEVTGDTWGALGWNIGAWSNQNDIDVAVTGNALSLNILSKNGWGELSWDDSGIQWGGITSVDISIGQQINVTGQQVNLTVGSVATPIAVDTEVTGSRINLTVNSIIVDISGEVLVTGSRINLTAGSVTTDIQADAGWGNNAWGIVPWGEENDVAAAVTGTQINTAIGIESISADANVSITGSRINLTAGSVDIAADGNVSVNVAEHLINISLNSITVEITAGILVTGSRINLSAGQAEAGIITEVDVTGSRINVLIGNEETTADANVSVTGSRINLTAGQADIAFGYDVTGSRLNTLINSVTIVGSAVVNLSGIRLNTSIGSVNVTAWAQVQTGANNTWTPVDLAA